MSKLGCGLVTVVALVVIAIGVPNLLVSKDDHGNETAAIATLRNLSSAQAMFQASGKCDLDGDGIGEFGTFGEMTAKDGLRLSDTGATRGKPVAVAVLSSSLADVNEEGVVAKSGYCFRIWLPGARSGGVHEGRSIPWTGGGWPKDPKEPAPPGELPGSPFTGPLDVNASEIRWCAYAWPAAYHNSGDRVFFVDQEGEVWQMANKGGRYSGSLAGPAFDAAVPLSGRRPTDPEVAGYDGRDGNLWKRVN